MGLVVCGRGIIWNVTATVRAFRVWLSMSCQTILPWATERGANDPGQLSYQLRFDTTGTECHCKLFTVTKIARSVQRSKF
eukprot:3225999-Rhodomonas_salina.1